jgi:hypothetical protein
VIVISSSDEVFEASDGVFLSSDCLKQAGEPVMWAFDWERNRLSAVIIRFLGK